MTKMVLRAKEDIKVVDRFIKKGEFVFINKTNDKGDTLISNESQELLVWIKNNEFADLVELHVA